MEEPLQARTGSLQVNVNRHTHNIKRQKTAIFLAFLILQNICIDKWSNKEKTVSFLDNRIISIPTTYQSMSLIRKATTSELIKEFRQRIDNSKIYNLKELKAILDDIYNMKDIKETTSTQHTQPTQPTQPTTRMLPTMNKTARVEKLKEHLMLSKIKHEEIVMQLSSLKDAHVYCVMYGLSAQQYGPLLEKYIMLKFGYIKNKAEHCTGDCSKNGKNSEIKVSLGGANHTKFNFVQIRPSHDCDEYILTAYHLSSENVETEGELYIFKVPKEEIKKIIVSYGGYAHGTIKEHKNITIDSMNDTKSIKEYALRPSINDECWKALLEYRIPESRL